MPLQLLSAASMVVVRGVLELATVGVLEFATVGAQEENGSLALLVSWESTF